MCEGSEAGKCVACLKKEKKVSLAVGREEGRVQCGLGEMVRPAEPHPEENGGLSEAQSEEMHDQMGPFK